MRTVPGGVLVYAPVAEPPKLPPKPTLEDVLWASMLVVVSDGRATVTPAQTTARPGMQEAWRRATARPGNWFNYVFRWLTEMEFITREVDLIRLGIRPEEPAATRGARPITQKDIEAAHERLGLNRK
jgi:hypothetical protein